MGGKVFSSDNSGEYMYVIYKYIYINSIYKQW